MLEEIGKICRKYKSVLNKCAGCPFRESYSIERETSLGRCFKEIPPEDWDYKKIETIVYKLVLEELVEAFDELDKLN